MQNAAMLLLKCWWYKTVLASLVFQNDRCFSASSFVCTKRPVHSFIYYLFLFSWSYSHQRQQWKSVASRKAFLHSGLVGHTAELNVTSLSKKNSPYLTLPVHPTQFVEQGHLSGRQETQGWGYTPAQPPTCQSTVASQRLCTNKLIELTLKSTAGPQRGNYKSSVISGT